MAKNKHEDQALWEAQQAEAKALCRLARRLKAAAVSSAGCSSGGSGIPALAA